ncbi:hypothetical protein M5689_021018 [Euphorbia peplus]|nr:hypothetical protein M5689_021018 [Euphorbia peplus]
MEVQASNEDDDHLSPSPSSPSHSNTTTTKTTTKRTRDQPNLTQCQSCNFRLDSCSGNDTLQLLYSEWRVVLLCQSCFLSVQSSNLCSYCFKNGSSQDSFTCPKCNHIVHKSCFSSHANVAPWSFSCTRNSQFSVCLDCWVPDKRVYKKNPLVFDVGNCRKRWLKNVVRDANFDARRKVHVANKAWELAVEKALAARRMARLADTAVSSIGDVELSMRTSLKVLKKNFSANCRILEVPPVISVPVPETSDYHSLMNLDGSVVPAVESYDRGLTRNFIKYARRSSASVFGDRKPDRYMIKYTRRASTHETYYPKAKQYLMKYARRTSPHQQFRGKVDRFAIKYSRRRLYQRPILNIPTREGATYDAARRENDI